MLPGLQTLAASVTASVVDSARIEGLAARLGSLDAEVASLYQGKSAEELADVAPYLVATAPDSDADRLLFGELWGQSAAVHFVSPAPVADLRRHLRHFLMVVTDDGKTLYFRFYDPRVLRIFLPTCSPEQLRELFGPIEAIWVEDADPGHALRFSLEGDQLRTEAVDLSADPARKVPPRIDWKGRRR